MIRNLRPLRWVPYDTHFLSGIISKHLLVKSRCAAEGSFEENSSHFMPSKKEIFWRLLKLWWKRGGVCVGGKEGCSESPGEGQEAKACGEGVEGTLQGAFAGLECAR